LRGLAEHARDLVAARTRAESVARTCRDDPETAGVELLVRMARATSGHSVWSDLGVALPAEPSVLQGDPLLVALWARATPTVTPTALATGVLEHWLGWLRTAWQQCQHQGVVSRQKLLDAQHTVSKIDAVGFEIVAGLALRGAELETRAGQLRDWLDFFACARLVCEPVPLRLQVRLVNRPRNVSAAKSPLLVLGREGQYTHHVLDLDQSIEVEFSSNTDCIELDLRDGDGFSYGGTGCLLQFLGVVDHRMAKRVAQDRIQWVQSEWVIEVALLGVPRWVVPRDLKSE
jgi:hypothetical protein